MTPSEAVQAVQAVRGVLSFFLAIGLWKVLDIVEARWGRKTAMWAAAVIGCIAFILLEEYPRPNGQ